MIIRSPSAHTRESPRTPARALLLIHRHRRQFRWLNKIFRLFNFVSLIHQLAAGIDQPCGDEDNEVPLDVLLGVRPEEAANERDVTDEGCTVLGLLHVLTH